ncbi:MAG: UDP-N-acetylmuramoyl-tripeptide--D-alanyl-D-alanine ligase [Spirochaetales bacterium]
MDNVLFYYPEVVRLVEGKAYHLPFAEREGITKVISDSREATRGCLFVPLKGERTDGHYYIQEVFSKGGRASFVAEEFWSVHDNSLKIYATQYRGSYIIVPSPLGALHKLAQQYLSKQKVHRIGITGSNGKTTTKEIVGAILARYTPTFMNRGNFNSEIGLPLSVFEIPPNVQWAVFEMGMNRVGEIKELANIVNPELGLITNIGTAHIGLLGSQQAIAAEKKELFQKLPRNGVGFVYEGEAFASFLREDVSAQIKTYGETSTPGFEGAENLGLKGWRVHLEGKAIHFPLIGAFNLRNALGAISLCREIGVPMESIQSGLESIHPLFGRGQILEGPITIVLDCYNANPNSMEEALQFFHKIPWQGRKIVILGAMKELGFHSAEAHKQVGQILLNCLVDGVFLVGDEMEIAYEVIRDAWKERVKEKVVFYNAHLEALLPLVKRFLQTGDLVLLKGSRSMELERVVKEITNAGAPHV